MSPRNVSIFLGGVVPAFLFGVSGVFQKVSTRAGIGTGPYLIGIGLTVVVMGGVVTVVERDATINARSALATALYGVFWGAGMACIAIALRRFDGRISQIVPLYNMNTLVAVLLGLVIFSEWRTLNVGRLLVAATMIILGGVVASRS